MSNPVGLSDSGSVRPRNLHVSLEVGEQDVQLFGDSWREPRLHEEAAGKVGMERVEELFIVERRSDYSLLSGIRFLLLYLEAPSIRNVLASVPPPLLGIVESSFLPIFLPLPHFPVHKTVKHTKDGNASVSARLQRVTFRQHW